MSECVSNGLGKCDVFDWEPAPGAGSATRAMRRGRPGLVSCEEPGLPTSLVQGQGPPAGRSSAFLRRDLVLFTYLHLAGRSPTWAGALLDAGTTGVAYETVPARQQPFPCWRPDE